MKNTEVSMGKTRQKGRKKKKSQLVLPPCRVCGGNATGIHYGVNTCQGCKAFFQRYQKRKGPYVCQRSGNCEIVARKRGICSACRVQKCTRLGMSKTGIRLGRYTLTERTETIKEVKNIAVNETPKTCNQNNHQNQRSQKLFRLLTDTIKTMDNSQIDTLCWCSKLESEEKSTTSEDCNFHNTDTHEPACRKEQLFQLSRKLIENQYVAKLPSFTSKCSSGYLHGTGEQHSGHVASRIDSVLHCADDGHLCDYLESDVSFLQDLVFNISPPLSPQTVSTFTQNTGNDVYLDFTDYMDEESCNEVPVINDDSNCIEGLIKTYLKMVVAPDLSTEDIKDVLKLKYEKYKEKTHIFGEMKALCLEEYRSIHQTTGLDVDGRLELIKKLTILQRDSWRQRYNFAKKIPGFASLCKEDQESLLMASAFECELLCSYRGVDPELGMVLLKTGDVFHIDQLSGMFESSEKCMLNLKMCKKVQDLNLTNEELALCLAITQTFPDRRRLRNPGKVEEIQLYLVSQLHTRLQERLSSKALGVFSKIIDMLSNLRVFTEETRKSFRKLYQDEFTRQICPCVPVTCLIEY